MAYQYGDSGGHFGSRSRYPMASGVFNPRSPPNVVPTASLVQMTPGTSLRSYATQGGHGLPPAYPYQMGQESRGPLQPPPLVYHHHQHDHHLQQAQMVSSPMLSPSTNSPVCSIGIPASGESHLNRLRMGSQVTQAAVYGRPCYPANGLTPMEAAPMSPMMGSPNMVHPGQAHKMPLHCLSPAGSGSHSSPPLSPHGVITSSPGFRMMAAASVSFNRMEGPASHGQTHCAPERERGTFLYPSVSFLYVLMLKKNPCMC